MDAITNQLFIADELAVKRLSPDSNKFDSIVTVGYTRYKNTPPEASDTGDELYFADGEHDYSDFKRAVDYVINKLENGETVLVHCQAGISRSAGVCSAALTETTDMTLEEALRAVEDARSIVNPASEIRSSMKQYTDQTLLPEYTEDTTAETTVEHTDE